MLITSADYKSKVAKLKLRRIIQDYFSFTKNERIGLVVLISLILILLAFNRIIFYFETPGRIDQERYEELMAMLEKKSRVETKSEYLFVFDPNKIDSLQLDSLLLPMRVKYNLLKYRVKGGFFYKPEDFKKLYGMNDSIYASIKNYIQIEQEPPRVKEVHVVYKANTYTSAEETIGGRDEKNVVRGRTVIRKIEMNSATADELEKLHGIGPVLSKRIIKYRNLLGGFSELKQLHEVYGLKPETIEKILPYLILEDTLINKINVNFAEAGELAKHPYISWDLANKIVKFRSVEGFVNDLESMRLKGLINESDYQRISPYMKTKN